MISDPPRFALFLVISSSFFGFSPVFGNPAGEVIRHGQVQFERSNGGLRIVQGSDRAIIDWDSFSIANGELTQFVQPSQGSAVLNRVSGASVSQINGALRANGNVFLLNPNGIVIGPTGTIDAGGFVASTLDISDADFLAGGDLRFRGDSQNGIVNLGRIDATGGDVFLIAATVRNAGTITANNGTVGLAAGNDVLLMASGDERVFVRGASGGEKENGVLNEGTIRANIAELKAYGGNVYGMAVNNRGRVAATGISREGGQIFLRAGGSRRSKIRNTGTLKATRPGGNGGRVVIDAGREDSAVENAGSVEVAGGSGTGGEIVILGSQVQLETNSLVIADGALGGGNIFIGGGERGQDDQFFNATDVTVQTGADISANGTSQGDGGRVIVFAENRLDFAGQVSATGGSIDGDGGFIELSGKNEVLIPDLSSRVKLSSPNGRSGILLFDPNDINVVDGPATGGIAGSPTNANTLNDADINDFLANVGSLVIETNPVPTSGNGDIVVNGNAEILWNTSNALTFNATRDFSAAGGASIISQGDGDLNINAGRTIGIFANAQVNGNGGEINLIAGTSVQTFAGTTVSTNAGNITIEANTAGASVENSIGLRLGSGQIITNGSGDITINARGGGSATTALNVGVDIFNSTVFSTSTAADAGAISITGTGGSNGTGQGYGIRLESSSPTIRSVNGDITLVGVGGGGGDNNDGVFIDQARVQSIGTGPDAANISITGTGSGTGVNNNRGFAIQDSSRILSVDGDVDIVGTGGGTGAGNVGFAISNGTFFDVTGDGNVDVRGDGANGEVGVSMTTTSTLRSGIFAASGDVVVKSDQNIDIDGGPVMIETTTGNIEVSSLLDVTFRNGSSAESASGDFTSGSRTFSLLDDGTELLFDQGNTAIKADRNILISGDMAGIVATDGMITLEANTAGTQMGAFDGILIENSGMVQVGNGSISMTAIGGNLAPGNRGIRVQGATISATGAAPGLISLNGTGGSGTADQLTGVGLLSGAEITSNGDISITGVGGGVTGSTNAIGIDILDGTVRAGSGGNIVIDGTGGEGTFANGTRVASTVEATGTGDVEIIGNSGADPTSRGFVLALSGEVTATTGDISINTDSIVLSTGTNIQSSGNLSITPNDSTLAIQLSDLAPDEGNLQLGSGEIATFADGFNSIRIGDSDAGSGIITVVNQTFTDPLFLTAPGSMGSINVIAPLLGTGDATLNLTAGSTIFLSDDVRTAGGTIRFNGPVVLQNDVVVDSTNSGAVAAGANVTFQDAVTGDGSPRTFTVRSGTAGILSLRGDVGANNFIDNINLDGATIGLANSVVAQSDVNIVAHRDFALGILGSVTAGNDISITANAAGNTGSFDAIDIRGPVEATNGTLTLTATSGDDPGDLAVNLMGFSGRLTADSVMITAANQLANQTAVLIEGSVTSENGVSIESGRGDIEINAPVSVETDLELTGVGSEDFDFIIRSGVDASDLVVSGGTGTNTLDFFSFTGGPVAIGVDQLTDIGILIGSGNSNDRITLSALDDTIEIGANNSGTVNSDLQFAGFENIDGGNGNDTFNFNGLFTFFGLIDGGMGNDALNIDTANGTTPNDAVIEEARISINPVWDFSGFESVSLQMGGGNDTVTSQFTSFLQSLDGGAGTDTLIFSQANQGAVSPLTQTGSGSVSFINFEAFNFGPNSPTTPFPAAPTNPFSVPVDPGTLLQIQVGNDNPDPTGIGDQGVITFADSTGVVGGGGAGLGGIETSLAAFSAFAQQGIILVGLDSSPLYVPLSIDGLGGLPSDLGALSLLNALSPESNVELLNALGLDLGIYLVDPDGPFAIDLSGRPQAAATLQGLLSQLSPNVQAEVQSAIEMAVAVPLVPVDGPIQMDLENPPPPQAVVIIFNQEVGAEALAELNAALGR